MERLHHIDVAKGIAILLTVIGHCTATALGDHSRLFYTIYAFHMPLWFFLSGILYRQKKNEAYFAGKVKSLLLPYLIFSFTNVVSYYFMSKIHHVQEHEFVRFGGLWFLLALFYVVIIYYVIDNACLKSVNNKIKNIITSFLSILLVIVGMGMGREESEPMHALATTMVCFFFFHIGVKVSPLKNILLSEKKKTRLSYLALGLFLMLILSIVAPMNPEPIDVNYGRYGNKWMFLAFALIGIIGVWFISLSVYKNKMLEYLGRNSLMILILHIPLWRLFDFVAFSNGLLFYYKLIFTFCCAFIVSLLLIIPINKYLPELKGQFHFYKTEQE